MLELIADDLLAYYKFDTPSGVTFDSYIFEEHLSNVNGVSQTTGKIGQGAAFVNASVKYLEASGSNVFDFDGTEDWTIACWAEVDSLSPPGSDQFILSKYDDNPATFDERQYAIFFDASEDRWRALISENGATNSADVSPTNTIAANTFYLLVLEYQASTKTLTLTQNNGTGGDTASAVATNAVINQSPATFKIGFGDTTADPALDGTVDEVLIWNRLLTTAEKTAMYNSGAGVNMLDFIFPSFGALSGYVGGYMVGAAAKSASGSIGGYSFGVRSFGPDEESTGTPILGGYIEGFSQKPDASGCIGGYMSSISAPISGQIGGYIFGVQPVPGHNIGGLLFSKARLDQRNNQYVGAWIKAPGFTNGQRVGGFLLAQPLQSAPTAFLGGAASGALQFGPEEELQGTPRIGGWIFGRPDATQYAEQHSRTLVKARSEDVVDQGLNIDNQLILFQRENANFWGRVQTESTDFNEFHGRMAVESFRERPTSDVVVNSFTDASGVTEVEVCASGIPGEAGTFFTFGEIDFGEPYLTLIGASGTTTPGGVAFPTVSGSVSGYDFFQLNPQPPGASGTWQMKAKHVYDHPGHYIITTKFIDNLGMVHMRGFFLDLLGAGSIDSLPTVPTKGVDYPGVDISGLPRLGNVPPSLLVDFDMRASGLPTEKIFPERDAVVTNYNKDNPGTNNFLQWNFGNGVVTTDKRPFNYYQNPGFYVPVFRYQFRHPSGTLIDPTGRVISPSGGPPGGSGAILGPQYGPKSIWLAESLLIGFNT